MKKSEAQYLSWLQHLLPAHSGFSPPIPQTFEDLGISQSLVLDLVLRRLLLEGFSNLQSLSNTLKLSVPILNIVFTHMRQQQLVEVKGMLGNDYNFTLSQAGKMLAGERFQISQYAGAAPVSLKDYHSATKAQAAQVRIDRKILRSAFSDLVVNDQLLDQLGPALDLAKLHLRLRAHRQRQNQPGGENAARLSGRGADALRRGSGQPGDQLV